MSLDYIRNHYRVPATEGARVKYTGGRKPRLGTIVGADGAYLLIRLDGQKSGHRYHPTWEITYLKPEAPEDNPTGGEIA